MKLIKILAFFFLFLNLSAFSFSQESAYRDRIYHFSFDMPSGWYRISNEILQRQTREAERLTRQRTVGYIGAIQFGRHENIQDPYILLQVHNVKITWQEFRDMVSENSITNDDMGNFSGYIKNFNTSSSFLDYNKKMFILNVEADVAGAGRKRSMAVMILGKNNIIQLNINMLKSHFNEYINDVNKIIDSFQYDAGYRNEE
jgi:hypothetical protein